MIDLTHADVFLLDGHTLPVSLLRDLLKPGAPLGRVRAEFNDGTLSETEVRLEGNAVHFLVIPHSRRPATDTQPVELEHRAELVHPSDRTNRRWVTRGDQEHERLVAQGYTETGITRPKTVRQVVVDSVKPNGGKP